jgi:CRISPR-associated Csx3 family protein
MIVIDIGALYQDTAKLSELERYKETCLEQAGAGNDVVLTGRGPVWLYLVLAHALHGKAKRLHYRSPVTGDVLVFNHDPFP